MSPSSTAFTAAWNMLVLLAAAALFALSDRSSFFAGSLRLSVNQFGSTRLKSADLSDAASEVLLVLERVCRRGACESSRGFVAFLGGIMLFRMFEKERMFDV